MRKPRHRKVKNLAKLHSWESWDTKLGILAAGPVLFTGHSTMAKSRSHIFLGQAQHSEDRNKCFKWVFLLSN